MLSDFQNSVTSRFTSSSKFPTKSSLTIPPPLIMLLHYVVKYQCSKKLPCSRPECMKQAVMQGSAAQNSCQKFLTVILALFSSLTKRYTAWR